MADKQQITPWSIYDKFQGDRELQNRQPEIKRNQVPKQNRKTPYIPICNKKSHLNVNIQALLNPKLQPSSQRTSPRKNDDGDYKAILTGRRKKSILSGKAMKYNTYEHKDETKRKKPEQEVVRENLNTLLNDEYNKTVKAINAWLLIQAIKEELKDEVQNIEERNKNFSLPKITKNFQIMKHSDSQRYEMEIRKMKKDEKIIKKDRQAQRSFETIHIGRVLQGISREKILKEFSKQKMTPRKEERLELKFFPKGLSKKIKFRNQPINASKNLLSELYGKNQEFNDKEIHEKLQLAKRNIKRSRIPTVMKSSVYEEQIKQLTQKQHKSLYQQQPF